MSTMRIGGLASGMDIDSIVEKLMIVERSPLDKLEQQKQTYEWQRDAYRDVNTKLKTFDTYIADNLILKSLNAKTATTSNSDYVTATATSAASGTLTIEGVSQLATAARGVGSQVNATGSTTLGELFKNSNVDVPTNKYIEIRAIQKDGTLATEKTKIEFTTDMTVNQFVSKINGSTAGVNAVFENGRLSITAEYTGDVKGESEIVVDAGQDVFKAFGFSDPSKIVTEEGTNAIFQVNGIATERSTNTFTISGYSVTLKDKFNSDTTMNELLKATFTEKSNAEIDLYGEDGISGKQKIYEDKKAAYDKALQDFNTFFNTNFLAVELSSDLQGKYTGLEKPEILTKLDFSQIEDLSTVDFTDETTNIDSKIDGLPADKFSTQLKEELKTLSQSALQTLQSLTEPDFDELKRVAKLESTYKSLDKTFLKNLSDSETNNEIDKLVSLDLSGNTPLANVQDTVLKDKLSKLTVSQINSLDNLSKEELTIFKKLATEEVRLNLSTLESEKNKAEASRDAAETRLNNATATLKDLFIKNEFISPTATDEEFEVEFDKYTEENPPQIVNPTPSDVSTVTLTSTTNVDEIITKIKDFVTTYNGLITDLNNLTTEERYRDYKPLTTLQRKDMEEKEIELWEEKAKSGLLRGDSIIRNGTSAMRSLVYESNPALPNSKYNTLYSVGITTSKDYLSGGTLEINENKLRAALEEDPDAVTQLFTYGDGEEKAKMEIDGKTVEVDTRGYLRKLRGAMDTIKLNIEERAGRSTMNQSQYTLGKYLRDVDDRIDTWQDKLVAIEDRYWRQFTAMETMISKANNQSAMLMGQFY